MTRKTRAKRDKHWNVSRIKRQRSQDRNLKDIYQTCSKMDNHAVLSVLTDSDMRGKDDRGQQGGGRLPPIGQTNTLHFSHTTDINNRTTKPIYVYLRQYSQRFWRYERTSQIYEFKMLFKCICIHLPNLQNYHSANQRTELKTLYHHFKADSISETSFDVSSTHISINRSSSSQTSEQML